MGVDDPLETLSNPNTTETMVTDAESGVEVPVIPVDDGVVSQPVVQPIPNETEEDSPQ